MPQRKVYDEEGHAHFVTFSCYKRRSILNTDTAKRIVIEIMHSQLNEQNANCAGFVIMTDHVHSIFWFAEPEQLSIFMKLWKQQSSVKIETLIKNDFDKYESVVDLTEPIWQRIYYSFNLN